MSKELISDSYKLQIKELHNNSHSFGNDNLELNILKEIITKYPDINSITDYGCGKGQLVNSLRTEFPLLQIDGYDPGIDIWNILPRVSDLVTSTDVLEHIEPDLLSNVLKHIYEISSKYTYLEISCFPAKKSLSDGRNAHLIIKKPKWWKEQLLNHWLPKQILDEKVVKLDHQISVKNYKSGKLNDIIYLKILLKK